MFLAVCVRHVFFRLLEVLCCQMQSWTCAHLSATTVESYAATLKIHAHQTTALSSFTGLVCWTQIYTYFATCSFACFLETLWSPWRCFCDWMLEVTEWVSLFLHVEPW